MKIASDSWAAFTSIKSVKSSRLDIIFQMHNLLHIMHNKDMNVCFVWVPAHVGVEGNEDVDILAKQSLRIQTIDVEIPLCKAESKSIIKEQMQIVWQEY